MPPVTARYSLAHSGTVRRSDSVLGCAKPTSGVFGVKRQLDHLQPDHAGAATGCC